MIWWRKIVHNIFLWKVIWTFRILQKCETGSFILHLNWRCQSDEPLQPSVSVEGQLHVLEIRKKRCLEVWSWAFVLRQDSSASFRNDFHQRSKIIQKSICCPMTIKLQCQEIHVLEPVKLNASMLSSRPHSTPCIFAEEERSVVGNCQCSYRKKRKFPISECPTPINFNGVKRDLGKTIDASAAYNRPYKT